MTRQKGTHLTLEDRIMIQDMLDNKETRISIANKLNVNRSTITKEINRNSTIVPINEYFRHSNCKYKNDCYSKKPCKYCAKFEPIKCKHKLKYSICNGCSKFKDCKLAKTIYNAVNANKKATQLLTESRQGFNLTIEEINYIGNILKKELDINKNSPYMILVNHPEIDISLKTLYNYIDAGIFKEFNVINLSLRRKPKRKLRKKYNNKIKKRIERKYLNNRLYSDFKSYEESYLKEGKPFIVLQMDTVYNDVKDGPFIQTFMIDKLNLFLAIYHKSKTANDMVRGIETLFNLLGEELFTKYISCILTDRGSEFCKADEIEKITKTKIFYCNPMCPYQKGQLENIHIQLRYILPKEKDLYALGLENQTDLNKVISIINSIPRKELNNKTNFMFCSMFAPDLIKKIEEFNIKQLGTNELVLSPKILLK